MLWGPRNLLGPCRHSSIAYRKSRKAGSTGPVLFESTSYFPLRGQLRAPRACVLGSDLAGFCGAQCLSPCLNGRPNLASLRKITLPAKNRNIK